MNTLLKFGTVKKLVDQEIQARETETNTASVLRILVDGELESMDTSGEFWMIVCASEVLEVLDTVYVKLFNLIQNQSLKNQLLEILNETRRTQGNNTISDETLLDTIEQISDPEIYDECARFQQSSNKITEMIKNILYISKNSDYRLYYDYIATLKIADEKKIIESKELLKQELEKIHQSKLAAKRFIYEPVKSSKAYTGSLKNLLLIPPGILRGIDIGYDGAVIIKILQKAEIVANYFLKQLS